MKTQKPFCGRFALAPLAFVFAFALAGCGGGGGSSGGGGGGGGSTASMMPDALLNIEANRTSVNTQTKAAVAATPNEGSVTQSSTVDGNNVTIDQVEATATYNGGNLRVSVANQRSGSWGTVDSGDALFRSNTLVGTNTGDDYRERFLGKTDSNGTVYVDVFTNRLSAADTDYLVGGVWLFIPSDATAVSDFQTGAFTDGSIALTPTAYIQTTRTASYQGDATGLYTEVDGGLSRIGEFAGNVSLNASFGTSPTVSGTISDFVDIDSTRIILTPVVGNPTLNLGSASIDASDGGLFTGDTSGIHRVDNTTYNYAGKWGGQFYGDEAQNAIGTFGASTSGNVDGYELSFVGTYGTNKQ